MKTATWLTRLALAAALVGSLSACTIVPAHPGVYRGSSVYVETYPSYPTYRHGYSTPYYGDRDHHHGDRERRHFRDERRYDAPHRRNSPLENIPRPHRDIRRSLGLPR